MLAVSCIIAIAPPFIAVFPVSVELIIVNGKPLCMALASLFPVSVQFIMVNVPELYIALAAVTCVSG